MWTPSPALAQRFTVLAVPTLLVLHGGDEVARQAGAAPLNVLRDWIRQALDRQPSPSRSDAEGER